MAGGRQHRSLNLHPSQTIATVTDISECRERAVFGRQGVSPPGVSKAVLSLRTGHFFGLRRNAESKSTASILTLSPEQEGEQIIGSPDKRVGRFAALIRVNHNHSRAFGCAPVALSRKTDPICAPAANDLPIMGNRHKPIPLTREFAAPPSLHGMAPQWGSRRVTGGSPDPIQTPHPRRQPFNSRQPDAAAMPDLMASQAVGGSRGFDAAQGQEVRPLSQSESPR